LLGEKVPRGVEARLHHRRVLHHRARECAGVLRIVGGLGIAVHVGNEGRVALLRELPRLVMDMLADAPPFMHHDDPGSLGLDGVVVHDEALHGGLPVHIGNRLFLDRSVCIRDRCNGAKCAHYHRSHANLQWSWHTTLACPRFRCQMPNRKQPPPSQPARGPSGARAILKLLF